MKSNILQTNNSEQQNNLENSQTTLPQSNDSALLQTISQKKINLVNIDSIKVFSEKKQDFAPQQKEAVKPSITLKDSLKLNLTGKQEPYTNWKFTTERPSNSFDETIFTQIDYKLLKQDSRQDSLYVLSFDNETDSVKIEYESSKTFSEISIVNDEQVSENNNILSNNNSFLLLLLASVIFVGFVKLYQKDIFNNIFRMVFQQGIDKETAKGSVSNRYPSMLLYFLFFFNSSLFIYELLNITDFRSLQIDLVAIPIIFVALLTIFSVKSVVFNFIAYVFDTQPQIKLYLKNSFFLLAAFAVIIMPITIVAPFLKGSLQFYVLKFGIFIFILLYINLIWKGVKIILKETYSLYYIFLYLCTLEILPLLFIIKFIS